MRLFDAHCHLQDDALFPDLGNVMERAAAAGIEGIAVCGTSSKDWKNVLELAEKFPTIGKRRRDVPVAFPMIGIHPWFVGCRAGAETPPQSAITDRGYNWKEDFQTLEKTVRADVIGETGAPMLSVGIGETGLDFQERFTNRAEQEGCFAAHLNLARELNRPVTVHCVQAWGRLVELLREFPEPKKIIHAFSGAVELMDELAELNCYFSFCGNVTNPKAKRVHAAAVAVPAERLLIETDSPDFRPAGCPKPNEPANLIHVARAVAQLRGVAVEGVASETLRNAKSIFL